MSRAIRVTYSLALTAALSTGVALSAAGAIPGQSRAAPQHEAMYYKTGPALTSTVGASALAITALPGKPLMYHDGKTKVTFDGRIWLVKPGMYHDRMSHGAKPGMFLDGRILLGRAAHETMSYG